MADMNLNAKKFCYVHFFLYLCAQNVKKKKKDEKE